MRLQLRQILAGAVVLTSLVAARAARAQVVVVDTSHTLFHESPTRTNMTVYTPGLDIAATPIDWLSVRGGYEADIVSGASVAVKAGPAYAATNPGADVITTASVHDVRQSPTGGVTLRKGDVEYSADYTYSTEHDYISDSLYLSAKTEAFDHDTQLELSYARNWDLVCDRVQSRNDAPPRFRALEDSTGCFTGSDPLRTRHALGIDGFNASWTQAWTPVFSTQMVYTAQIIDGFQSNPYRSVILGQGLKAQEHHPNDRDRQSLQLRLNYFVRPLKLVFRLGGRAYHDTWDITSGTGEFEADKYIIEGLRVAAHVRYYRQNGAVFWSDDYTGGNAPLGPKGQYWTGDRELSPFSSYGLGFRLTYALQAKEYKRVLGFLSGIKVGATGDVLQFDYDEYTLGGQPVGNARAFILGLNLSASF